MPAVEPARSADELLERCAPTVSVLADSTPALGAASELRRTLGLEEARLLAAWREGESAFVARGLGAVYAQADECHRATAWLAHSLAKDASDGETWYWFGMSRLLLGEPADALVLLERARALGHDTAAVRRYEGEAYLELGRSDRAREAFAAALARDADSWHAGLGLAALLEDDGALEPARDLLVHLVELDDEHPTPLFRLARVERALGHEDAALAAERSHRRAAILDDMRMRGDRHSDVQKHLAVGFHLVAQGRPAEALVEYEAARAKAGDPRFARAASEGIARCRRELEAAADERTAALAGVVR
jgi:tetratricopeptide (TPR) repeat protein